MIVQPPVSGSKHLTILSHPKHNSLHFDRQNKEDAYMYADIDISVMDQYLPVGSGNKYNNKTKMDSSFTSL